MCKSSSSYAIKSGKKKRHWPENLQQVVFLYINLSIKFVYSSFTRKEFLMRFLVVILIFSWLFSSWPRIFGLPPSLKNSNASAPTLSTLYPTNYSSQTGTSWTTTTFENIDEGIAGADGSFIVAGSNSTSNIFYEVTDMPSDFGKMVTLSYDIRFQVTPVAGDTEILYVQVFKSDKTTPLTDEMTVISTTATEALTNKGVTAFTGVSTSATKTDWNSAYFRIRTSHSANKGSDGSVWSIDAFEMTGTYNSPPTVALNSPADAATDQSVTPTLNFTGTDADSNSIEYHVQIDTVNTFNSDPSSFATVQTSAVTNIGGATSGYITLSPTIANNLVVVHVKVSQDTRTVTSVTDDKGNTYVVLDPVDSGTTNRLYQAYGVQVVGGVTTITVNFNLSATAALGADEYSGGALTNIDIFDVSSTGIGSSGTSMSVGSFNPSSSGELIVVTGSLGAATTWTAGTNYTNYFRSGESVTTQSEYRLSGDTSETAPWELGASSLWAERATAFIPGGGPLLARFSITDAGFTAGHPFTSGVAKDFTVQSGNTLNANTTYYWRVRAIDPTGSNKYGAWSSTRSFTTGGLSNTIEIRAQDYTTSVSNITFPEGDSGTIISNPYNDIDGVGSPQVFGGAGVAKPVVTLYNGGASTLTIWYNITTFTNGIVSDEYYLVNDKVAACADVSCITNTATFDTDTTTGTTIAVGVGNEKDLYLKINLNTVAGKSGNSTLTILGEIP